MIKFILAKKNGMSLLEALIAIGIFTMGIAGFTVFFAKTWSSNKFILEEGQASMLASRSVEQIVKDLRRVRQPESGEYPIKSCSDFVLVVFIDIDKDGVTEKVHYYAENQQLKRGISKPSGTPPVYPSEDQQVAVLANYIINTSSQPVFYFYNNNYPGDAAHNPINTPVNDIEDVRLIKVHLLVNIDPAHAPDNINIESFAELRNLNDYQ